MHESFSIKNDDQADFSNESKWFPTLEDYDPNITMEQWLELLNNGSIIGGKHIWAGGLAVFYVENDNAVLSVLNKKYGYNSGALSHFCTNIAQKVHKMTNCPVYKNREYWAILFQSESPDNGKSSAYRRKLRPELYEALTEIKISRYLPKEVVIKDSENVHNNNLTKSAGIIIDTSFDFTTDSHGKDPDSYSKTLQRYHQALWSKELPCGDKMELTCIGSGPYSLTWNRFHFASDTIIVSFRYKRYAEMLKKIRMAIPDYKNFMDAYVHSSYTIGGMTIFPKHKPSINQMRGMLPKISDRWDLTLECIRRYYRGEESPLYKYLLQDKAFFDLFVDFKGYVDYFFFQDCVTDNYSKVIFWYGNGNFDENPLPQSVEDYKLWIERELVFVAQRNIRISESLQ